MYCKICFIAVLSFFPLVSCNSMGKFYIEGDDSTCGNGIIDPGETCDPPSSCPTTCADADPCTRDVLYGSADSCNAVCALQPITECSPGDGCCPEGCDPSTDSDCSTSCGNGVIDPGETCDPPSSCPTSCDDDNPCTNDVLTGRPDTCDAACTYPPITSCTNGDGCCPDGCDSTTDSDCTGTCGDGTIDPGETCDPPSSCPTSCSDSDPCTSDVMSGSPSTCNVACDHNPVTSCIDGDGCCPSSCNSSNDDDCAINCRNAASWPSDWASFESDVITLINSERAAGAVCGSTSYGPAGPVTMNSALQESARCHSFDMAVNNFFDHTGSDGSNSSSRASAAGYTGWPMGEDIGAGYGSPASAVVGWMTSPPHCVAIMNGSANEAGVGFTYKSDTTWGSYWTLVMGQH